MGDESGTPDHRPIEFARQMAWEEYKLCDAGISRYDEHLFKIRSWNVTFHSLLITAFFGLKGGSSGVEIASGEVLLVALLITSAFWTLDAINKALQTVLTHRQYSIGETIKRFLDDGFKVPIDGSLDKLKTAYPKIASDFREFTETHRFRYTVFSELSSLSVFVFYLLPVGSLALALAAYEVFRTDTVSESSIYWPWVVVFVGLAAVLIASSVYRRKYRKDRREGTGIWAQVAQQSDQKFGSNAGSDTPELD